MSTANTEKRNALEAKRTLRSEKRKRTLRLARQNWSLYLLLLPAALYVLVFSYLPMYGIQIAFRNFNFVDGIVGSEWAGLKWFNYLIGSANFWPIIRNTLVISFYSLATFPIPILFALILHNITNEKFKKAAQTITYLPHFISMVVVVGMIYTFTSYNSGWINTLIETLGGERVNFMAEPDLYPHIYVWTGVWQQVGWSSIIYLAALTNVSPELHEAATIDGASKLKRIIYVDVPAIIPTILIMLVLDCGSIMAVAFDKSFLMQNSMNLSVSEVLSTYSYKLGLQQSKYSFSTMVSLFSNVVNFTFLTVVNTITKRTTGTSLW